MRPIWLSPWRALLLACAALSFWPPFLEAQPPPRRVVSLLPSATELIAAIGSAERLVAVTRHDRVGAARGLPRIGGPADPSLEAVAARRPDLVVAWEGVTPREDLRRLESVGVRVYEARIESLADVVRTARELGRLLGRGAAADSLAAAMEAALDSLRGAASGPGDVHPGRDAERPAVFLVLHPEAPLLTAGPGTYLDEVVRLAGGRNLFRDAPVRWPMVSAEAVIGRGPDVIVVAGSDAEHFSGSRLGIALRDLGAPRILPVPDELLLHPGPGSVELARRLARALRRDPGGPR